LLIRPRHFNISRHVPISVGRPYHEAAKKELSRFKGVGPKTVSCVLMFCLQRAEFPVARMPGGGQGRLLRRCVIPFCNPSLAIKSH
jgi:endonuclease III-like uncharacterized protein